MSVSSKQTFFGYEYDKYGRYDKPVELHSVQEVADFVTKSNNDKIITDGWDEMVVSTIGNFLDRVDRTKIPFDELFILVQANQAKSYYKEDKEPQTDYFNKANSKIRAFKKSAKEEGIRIAPEVYNKINEIYQLHKAGEIVPKQLYDSLSKEIYKSKVWTPTKSTQEAKKIEKTVRKNDKVI